MGLMNRSKKKTPNFTNLGTVAAVDSLDVVVHTHAVVGSLEHTVVVDNLPVVGTVVVGSQAVVGNLVVVGNQVVVGNLVVVDTVVVGSLVVVVAVAEGRAVGSQGWVTWVGTLHLLGGRVHKGVGHLQNNNNH